MPEDTLGERLRKYRYVNGISIHKIAEEIGVADSTVFCWENGQKIPGEKSLEKIIQIINT